MTIHPLLQARLEPLVRQRRRVQLWCKLAGCWAAAALLGITLLGVEQWVGWSSPFALPLAAVTGAALALLVFWRARGTRTNWRALALQVEAEHPELNGSLLTAVQQSADHAGDFTYLQQRVLEEALAHQARSDWSTPFRRSEVRFVYVLHLATLAIFAWTLWELRVPLSRQLFVPAAELAVAVTPGDVALERGSSLVVAARFKGPLPPRVDLVLADSAANSNRLQLFKSLGDPLFGATVPEVSSDLDYHLEYAGKRTRDYRVTVFEYPRLERADADITFPQYTRLGPKHVENTRRVSAVEGSEISLKLQLNKPVVQALLVAKGTNRVTVPLAAEANAPAAALTNLLLAVSRTYELQLVDAQGRTNKLPAQFVFEALKNRVPELKVTSPRGDTRPSALEEISFEGTVYDDFGLRSFGLASVVAGKDPEFIELGRSVPGREKRPFQFLLRLEDLGLQPDDLLSWFVWAEDVGPDGQVRRTAGDLYFAEVRPFEEIFREGQPMSGDQQQQQGGQQGGRAGQLAQIQKQIISATWKLLRQNGQPLLKAPRPDKPSDDKSSGNTPAWGTRLGSLNNHPQPGTVSGPRAIRGVFAQPAAADSSPSPAPRRAPRRPGRAPDLADDMNVVQDAQQQALDQAEAASQEQADPKNTALWEAVTQQMERALEKLRHATNSPAEFEQALAAEQAAYRALLKLQEREYSVSRSRSRQGGQNSGQQQRQLDQLDLSQAQDKYETERQARAPQSAERNEQLQVMNRLQELARRQQDLNTRLQELQSALQEARTEKEREEIRRQLKRLQEEEQQLLADADEARQRMDRPENQSRMAEQRQQMEQARNDLQRAAEAAAQGQPSQALAAGTRAQRQLQQMREDMRRQNAGEFEEELRQMRTDARELARQQEQLQKKVEAINDPKSRSLSDTDLQKQALEDLAKQRERLTNLVDHATELSRSAEEAEPLVSRELYDTVRRFAQNETSTAKQFREEFINRRLQNTDLYERLRRTAEESNAKSLDIASEMLRRGLLPDAGVAEERARAGINDLKRGVERAALNVVGDDTESLRRAGDELNRLAEQLQREIARGEGGTTNAPRELAQAGEAQAQEASPQPGRAQDSSAATQSQEGERQAGTQPGESQAENRGTGGQPGQRAGTDSQTGARENSGGQTNQAPGRAQGQGRGEAQQASEGAGRAGDPRNAQANNRPGGSRSRNNARNSGGGGNLDLDRMLDGRGGYDGGPITGEDFAPWSDRLREVEELVDTPSLRTDVARARERARQMRQDFKRSQNKPDWADVRLQVLKPLVEVKNQIDEELARREPKDNLVPIDRDPVPGRYSELVRRYYEELGKDSGPRESPGPNSQP